MDSEVRLIQLFETTMAKWGLQEDYVYPVEKHLERWDSRNNYAVIRGTLPDGTKTKYTLPFGSPIIDVLDKVQIIAERKHFYLPHDLFNALAIGDEQKITLCEDPPQDRRYELSTRAQRVHMIIQNPFDPGDSIKLYLHHLSGFGLEHGYLGGDIIRLKRW